MMKELNNNDNSLFEEYLNSHPNAVPDETYDRLRKIVAKCIEESCSVHREISSFSDAVCEGQTHLDKNQNKYPNLYETWCGDTYGVGEDEGLRELLKDLKKTTTTINKDWLLSQ